MNSLKSRSIILVLAIAIGLIYGCATYKGSDYNDNGYYLTTIDQSFDNVYNGALKVVKTGQTADTNNQSYDIKINKKTSDEAVIIGQNDTNPSDYIEIIIRKESADKTRLSIKYGKDGDSIRSSALIPIIQKNISKS
ncbi:MULTISPECIES: DUF3568 family protein [unclassified Francisella]|uniref:DUF3568 family protein n=1 Tax=unclassified Francisella TaxID=2610885 RepID=UPI002E33DD2C|nr:MULTISPECIES: DUF3568 family protein [unclassified Francisella]MED7818525.1 DUF3568 family protein [Francisella sp. 19S2-4]MED7829361.1 DUF3568 family protein [Francisella sp. 19S2-10]